MSSADREISHGTGSGGKPHGRAEALLACRCPPLVWSGMRSNQTVAVPTQTPYNGSNPSGSSGPLGAGQALGVEA